MSEGWLATLATSLISVMFLLGVVGFVLATIMPSMDRWNKRFFMVFFAIVVLGVGVSCVEIAAIGEPAAYAAVKITAFLNSLLPSLVVVMSTVLLLHSCNEPYRTSVHLRVVFAFWAVFFALLVIAQFTTAFYYFTPDGQLHYGPWFTLLLLPLVAILVLNLIGVIRRRDKLSDKRFYAFIAFFAPLATAMLVHACFGFYAIVSVALTTSALSMFAIIVLDQIEQYMRLQQEAANQRARIAMLQMRPHFIHNAMTSIYHLCDQDPKAAQQVTMDFNTYLRKNFKAIVSDDPIPFSEELEHTHAYLAVEQAQFASKLAIEYDTPHTHFHMPPLTLQPLAENSVKHGMSPQTVPLHITIRTRKTESGSEVIVEDNGPGFDPAVAADPHTTLANIRHRLAVMCNGTLEIAPREGGGTIVKVTIPQRHQ